MDPEITIHIAGTDPDCDQLGLALCQGMRYRVSLTYHPDKILHADIIVILASAEWLYAPASEPMIRDALSRTCHRVPLIIVPLGPVLINVSLLAGRECCRVDDSGLGPTSWARVVDRVNEIVKEKIHERFIEAGRWKGSNGPHNRPVMTVLIHHPTDSAAAERLQKNFATIQQRGLLWWTTGLVQAGEDFQNLRDTRLREADAVVLLVSVDLLAAPEMLAPVKRELEQRRPPPLHDLADLLRLRAKLLVLGVLVRACITEELSYVTILNTGNPISLEKDEDVAWTQVVKEIWVKIKEGR
jgi:hypothetical protein